MFDRAGIGNNHNQMNVLSSVTKSVNKSIDETNVDQLRHILHSVSAHLTHEQKFTADRALQEMRETLVLTQELILAAENTDKSHINSLEKQINHIRQDRDKQTAALRATVNQHAKDNSVLRSSALQLRKEAEEAIAKQLQLEKTTVAAQARIEVLENDLQQATQQIFQSQKQIAKVIEMERKDMNKNSKNNVHERLLIKAELDAVRAELHKERQHYISEKLNAENAVQHANATVTVVEQHIIELKEQLDWEKAQREEIERQYQSYYMENMHHQGHMNMKIQTDAKKITLNAAHTVDGLMNEKATLIKDAAHLGELVDSLAAKCVLYVDNLNLLRGKMVDMQYEIESAHHIMVKERATQPQCVEEKEQVLSMEASAALDRHFSQLKQELQELIVQNDALFDDFNTNKNPAHQKNYSIKKFTGVGSALSAPVDMAANLNVLTAVGSDSKTATSGTTTTIHDPNDNNGGDRSAFSPTVHADRDWTQPARIGTGTGPGIFVSMESGSGIGSGPGTDRESPFSPAASRHLHSNHYNNNNNEDEVVMGSGDYSNRRYSRAAGAGGQDSPSQLSLEPELEAELELQTNTAGTVIKPETETDVHCSAQYPYLAETGMAGIIASANVVSIARPPRSDSPSPNRTHGRGGHGRVGRSSGNSIVAADGIVNMSTGSLCDSLSCSPSAHSLNGSVTGNGYGSISGRCRSLGSSTSKRHSNSSHFSTSPYALPRSSSPLRASFSPTLTQELGASGGKGFRTSSSNLHRDTNITVSSPKDYIIVKESMSLLDKRYQDELYLNINKIAQLEEETRQYAEQVNSLKQDMEIKAEAHTQQMETLVREYEHKCSGLYDKIVHYQQVAEDLQQKRMQEKQQALARKEERERERLLNMQSTGCQMDESFLSYCSENECECDGDSDKEQQVGIEDPDAVLVQEGLGLLAGPIPQPNSPNLLTHGDNSKGNTNASNITNNNSNTSHLLNSQLEIDYIRDINNTNNMLSSMESRLQMLLNENGMLRKQHQQQKVLLEEHERKRQLEEQYQQSSLSGMNNDDQCQSLEDRQSASGFEPDSMAVLVGDEGHEFCNSATDSNNNSNNNNNNNSNSNSNMNSPAGSSRHSSATSTPANQHHHHHYPGSASTPLTVREGSAQTMFRGAADAASSTAELQQEWKVQTYNADTNTDTRIILLDNETISSLLHTRMTASTATTDAAKNTDMRGKEIKDDSDSGNDDVDAGVNTTAIVGRLQEILSESLTDATNQATNLTTPLSSYSNSSKLAGLSSSPYTTPIESRGLGTPAKGQYPPSNDAVVHVRACDLMLLLDKLYLNHIHPQHQPQQKPQDKLLVANAAADTSVLEVEVRALTALNEELGSKLSALEREYNEAKREMETAVQAVREGVSGYVSASKHQYRSPGAGVLVEAGAVGVSVNNTPSGFKMYGQQHVPETPVVGSASSSSVPGSTTTRHTPGVPGTGSPPSQLVQNISSLQSHLQELMTGKDNILGLVGDYNALQHRYNVLDTKYNVLSTQMSCIPPSILVAAAEKRVIQNKLQHTVDICNARIKAHISKSEREKSEFNNILRQEAEKGRNLNVKLKQNAVTIHQLTVQLKAYQIKEYSRESVSMGNNSSSGGVNSSSSYSNGGSSSSSATTNATDGYQANLRQYYAAEASAASDRDYSHQNHLAGRNAMTATDDNDIKLPPWLETDPNAYTRHDEILRLPDRIISVYESEQRLLASTGHKSRSNDYSTPHAPSATTAVVAAAAVATPMSAPGPSMPTATATATAAASDVPVTVPPPPPEESQQQQQQSSFDMGSPRVSSGLSFMKTAQITPAPYPTTVTAHRLTDEYADISTTVADNATADAVPLERSASATDINTAEEKSNESNPTTASAVMVSTSGNGNVSTPIVDVVTGDVGATVDAGTIGCMIVPRSLPLKATKGVKLLLASPTENGVGIFSSSNNVAAPDTELRAHSNSNGVKTASVNSVNCEQTYLV